MTVLRSDELDLVDIDFHAQVESWKPSVSGQTNWKNYAHWEWNPIRTFEAYTSYNKYLCFHHWVFTKFSMLAKSWKKLLNSSHAQGSWYTRIPVRHLVADYSHHCGVDCFLLVTYFWLYLLSNLIQSNVLIRPFHIRTNRGDNWEQWNFSLYNFTRHERFVTLSLSVGE